jgi:hypothetical protein
MLPLVSNALPSLPSTSASSAAVSPSQLAQGVGTAEAAARQILPNAVAAPTSTAAYFPETARQAPSPVNERPQQVRVPVPPPTGDYVVVDENAAPQQVVQAAQQAAAQQAQRSVPVTLGIPLTTQFTTQVIAQQPAVQQQQASTAAAQEEGGDGIPAYLRGREASFAKARGVPAYAIASARNATIPAPAPVETELPVEEAAL